MVRVTHLDFDGIEARALVEVGNDAHEIFIRTSSPIPEPRAWGDVWAPFGMFAGMKLGEATEFNAPLSWRRRRNLARAQDVLRSRFPEDFTRSKLVAPRGLPRRHARTGRVAQFFTGGIDSFYTMLTNPQVNVLVYAYDVVHEPPQITAILRRHLREIAEHYGKELVEIEYNARLAIEEYANWGQQSYTGVLSSFAALLSGSIDGMIVPSQYAGNETMFWGDHPDINDWWAPGTVSFRHDAGEVSRFHKTSLIASDEFARNHVRVCWKATESLNCETCEKCVRTRTAFETLEAGFSSKAFPRQLELSDVADLVFPHKFVHQIWQDNLDAAERAGRDDVARAIRRAFANSTA